MGLDAAVKDVVDVVQESDNFHRSDFGGYPREAYNVGEENGDVFEVLCLDVFLGLELLGHDLGQHLVDERLCTALLGVQFSGLIRYDERTVLDVASQQLNRADDYRTHQH